MRVRACGALLAALLLAVMPAGAAPSRVLSMNLCADQLVLALLPPERIVAVSYLARDCRISVACDLAASVPIRYGTAEEMLAAAPDLIIAGRYTTRPAVAVAQRLGLSVLDLDVPATIEEVEAQIGQVAAAVGAEDRGKEIVASLEQALAALPAADAQQPRPVAAVFETSGFTVGKGSLIDTLLARAGFDNLAVRLGIDNYPSLPLEALVAAQPDLLIVERRQEDRPSLGGVLLDHPVLKAAFPAEREIAVPQRLWLCGGPAIIDALRLLVAARQRLEGTPK
jgi:iron complex transport system substrate-binding protein